MAFIQIKNGKYTVRWRQLDGAECRRSCPTASSARTLKRDVEEAIATGKDWQPAFTGGEPDLEEIAGAYLDERAVMKAAPGTRRVAGMHLDLLIRFLREEQPRGTLGASLLSRPLMMRFMAWLSKPETSRHGNAARELETITKVVRNVELFWIWAEDSDRWPGLIPRPRRVNFQAAVRPAVVAPTWEEMDACVLQLRGWQRQLGTWLRYTGLRIGESMLFLWPDVDMERGTLCIRPEVDKNKIGRTVPLSPLILDEIATWGKREGYVIPCNRKPGPREREGRARDMARAWARAKVRPEVWKKRPDHAFRKGIKSGLLGLKATPDAVDYLQGHTLGTGSRGRYIDGAHLPLRETVALIPKIGASAGNLTRLPVRAT